MLDTLIFKTLKVEGFGSIIRHTSLKLDAPGLHVLRGKNGVGKTTNFSALVWALYGKTLKEGSTVETWEHLRKGDWSGTLVSVSFIKNGITYKVIRCKDYKKVVGKIKGGNRLVIEENGTTVDHLKDKRDLQKYLEQVIGMTYNLFSSSVLFAQKAKRFIQESGPQKKEILEESFRITWLSKAQDLAKAKRKELQGRLDKVSNETRILKESIVSMEELILSSDEAKKEFEKKKSESLEKLRKEIESLKGIIQKGTRSTAGLEERLEILSKDVESLKETPEYGNLRATGNRLSSVIANIRSKTSSLESAQKRLAHIKDQEDPRCYTCQQLIKGKSRLEVVNSLKTEISDTLGVLDLFNKEKETLTQQENKGKEIEALLSTKNTVLRELKEEMEEAYEINGTFRESEGRLKELGARLKDKEEDKFTDNTHGLLVNKKKLEMSLSNLQPTEKFLKGQIKMLDWAIRDPLSNTGIKSFLFSKLLDRLNFRLRQLGKFVDMQVELELDLTSGRKDINAIIQKSGAPVDYKDLSGGEAQLIDVIIALACGDVLLADSPVFLRVYDEVFESLDPDNIELVTNLIRSVAESMPVYVITHNTSFHTTGATILNITKDGEL